MKKYDFIETAQAKAPEIVEVKRNGTDYVLWGEDNLLPYELFNLYTKSSIMTSIVSTIKDYCLGDEVVNNTGFDTVNRKGMDFDELLTKCFTDYALFGGFAIQIIRTKGLDKIAELNWVDMRKIRTNKDEDTVWVNDWDSRRKKQPVKLPRYINGAKQPNSVFYYKGLDTRGVYPMPSYIGGLTSIQTSSEISNYNLKNVLNNFTPSAVINFNNGMNLSEDEIDELEQKVYDKFSGTSNAGKILLSFNDNQESATTIERLADDGLENKYLNLENSVMRDIYCAFRCNPILTGVNKENTGFSAQEYSEAQKLFNRTVIQPMQKVLINSFEKLFGKGCLEIKPFNINFDIAANTTAENNDTNTIE